MNESIGWKGARSGISRFCMALMALALCIGLMPSMGMAETAVTTQDHTAITASAETAGTATLTIVHGIGYDGKPTVLVNKAYGFYGGATVEDLLKAAAAAGDIKNYALNSYGYLASVTAADGTVIAGTADSQLYWSDYENGSFYGGSDTLATEKLVSGTSYQFAWASYPTAVAPSDWSACGTAGSGTKTAGAAATPTSKTAGTATLTIVHGIGYDGKPTVLVNKAYGFYGGATVEDLLKAAAAAGDIKGYALNSYGYLASVTAADGTVIAGTADSQLYWSDYENGSFYGGSDTLATEKLVSGTSYQFAWASYPTAVAPSDWSTCGKAGSGTTDAGTKPTVTPDPGKTVTPKKLDGTLQQNLLSNIAASYSGTGSDWQAMDLSAIGKGSTVDADKLIANALSACADPGTTDLQRCIISLTAAGIDPTAVPSSSGTVNLVEQLATTPGAVNTVNGRIFALLAYECGPYTVPSNATASESDLLNALISAQLSDGGFAYSGQTAEADMTAMAINALAPFASTNASAKTAMDKAVSALHALQLSDGGFSSQYDSNPKVCNTDTTAMAVVAMCAAGIDPATEWTTSDGSTPMSALLSQANSTQDGFLFAGAQNDLATEQGFRALAAYQEFTAAKGAYNIYTQAKNGGTSAQPKTDGNADDDDSGDSAVPSDDTSSDDAGTLAKTGDATLPAAAVLACLAAAALLVARKARSQEA